MKKIRSLTKKLSFMVFALMSVIILANVSAETTLSTRVSANQWDYLQLKISKGYSLDLKIESSLDLSFVVLSEQDFNSLKADMSVSELKTTLNNLDPIASSSEAQKTFVFNYTAAKNTILYCIFWNENNELTEISYTYNFVSIETQSIPGYSISWLLISSAVVSTTLFIIIRKKRINN